MIDYRAIIEDDPGGDLETATAALAAMTVESMQDKSVTYVSIAREAGADVADAFQDRVAELSAANVLRGWVSEALETEGLNVNNPQVVARLNAMVGGGFTQAHTDAILAMRVSSRQKHPGILPGHVQNAREWWEIWNADPGGDIVTALAAVNQTIARCGKGDLQKARGLWGEK